MCASWRRGEGIAQKAVLPVLTSFTNPASANFATKSNKT
jgi:hypothetical protein